MHVRVAGEREHGVDALGRQRVGEARAAVGVDPHVVREEAEMVEDDRQVREALGQRQQVRQLVGREVGPQDEAVVRHPPQAHRGLRGVACARRRRRTARAARPGRAGRRRWRRSGRRAPRRRTRRGRRAGRAPRGRRRGRPSVRSSCSTGASRSAGTSASGSRPSSAARRNTCRWASTITWPPPQRRGRGPRCPPDRRRSGGRGRGPSRGPRRRRRRRATRRSASWAIPPVGTNSHALERPAQGAQIRRSRAARRGRA